MKRSLPTEETAEEITQSHLRYIKRILDIVLSFVGLILSSWLFLIIIAAIEIDDPGPVFFTQKRVGIRKKHFNLYKFRSMKMSTPHDTPTHLLENPDQYIRAWGAFCARPRLKRFLS